MSSYVILENGGTYKQSLLKSNVNEINLLSIKNNQLKVTQLIILNVLDIYVLKLKKFF